MFHGHFSTYYERSVLCLDSRTGQTEKKFENVEKKGDNNEENSCWYHRNNSASRCLHIQAMEKHLKFSDLVMLHEFTFKEQYFKITIANS